MNEFKLLARYMSLLSDHGIPFDVFLIAWVVGTFQFIQEIFAMFSYLE